MNAKSVLPMLGPALVACWLLAPPSPLSAQAKGREADRELAAELSASLVLVANQARDFADARDQLARARLQTIHGLEENLVWLREGNDFELRTWKAIGETRRVELFEEVLAATEEIAARRQAAVERRALRERELAEAESAVARTTSQLTRASESLAALAEPPADGAALRGLVRSTLLELAESLGEGSPKLHQGLILAEQLLAAAEEEGGQP